MRLSIHFILWLGESEKENDVVEEKRE